MRRYSVLVPRLTPVQLGDPENPIRVEFFHADFPPSRVGPLLVVKVIGAYRVGCEGNPDAAFISVMNNAAIEYWDASGIVLDLTELKYDWGDMMDLVRSPPRRDFPHAVVVGPACRRAMETLIFGLQTTRRITEAEGYFDDDLDAAVEYVARRLPRVQTDTLLLYPPILLSLSDPQSRLFEPPPPMTQQQWLTSDDPEDLIRWAVWGVPNDTRNLPTRGWSTDWERITPAIERRMLRYAVACLRRIEHLMTDPRSRHVIDIAERLANDAATLAEFEAAIEAARQVQEEYVPDTLSSEEAERRLQDPHFKSANATSFITNVGSVARRARDLLPADQRDSERRAQADLVRDIFRNVFESSPR